MEKLNKYRFIKESTSRDPVGVRVTLDSEVATLDELCVLFEQYLRASGFVFEGHVDIVATKDLLIPHRTW